MAGYTRQSTADIVSNAVIKAAPVNAEYNALRDAFTHATGHKHDGSSTEGAFIPLISDVDSLNKVVIDTTNNRIGFFVQVSTGTVEQLRIQDGAIVPVTDSDIDLGASGAEFKDLYIDGVGYIDTVTVHENATIAGTLGVTGLSTLASVDINAGNIDGTVIGAATPAAATVTSLVATTADINAGTVDATIGGTTPAAGTFTSLVATTADINAGTVDATIGATTPAAGTFTSIVATTADINGGTIDGSTIAGGSLNNAAIGNSTASTVVGTTVTATNFVGPIAGAVTGNVTGNTAGVHTGAVTGDVTGNVTAGSGSSSFTNVTINGSLDMNAGTSATITGLSTPVQDSDAATKAYVDGVVAATVDSAPAALDTLNELAAALGDDANYAATTTTALGTKLPKAGGTMTGAIAMGTNKVTGLGAPTAGTDATTKTYVDAGDALQVTKAGDTMSGVLAMGANKITGVADPTAAQDVVTKNYSDTLFGSTTAAATSASNAATSATASANSATASANSATASANSATSAASSLSTFTGQYVSQSSTPSSPDTGDLWFDTGASIMKVYNGSGWVAAGSAVSGTDNSVQYTATSNQTTFNVTYDTGSVQVYLNGVRLDAGDYTATNGSSIVLDTGATVGDTVFIHSFGTFLLADHYSKVAADARFLGLAGGALTGAITTNSTIDGRDVAADGVLATNAMPKSGGAFTGAVTTNSTIDGRDVAADGVLATNAMPKSGGAFTGAVTTNSTIDGRDVAADGVLATNALPKAGGTLTGDVSHADNVKAKFGAGDDLQIYHTGSHSFVDDAGTGNLYIRSNSIVLGKYTGEYGLSCTADGSTDLYYDNAAKLATTSTGVDVTGTATTDGLTVDGAAVGPIVALTDASSIATNLALSNNFSVTLAGNRTLANPTNTVAGQSGSIFITQDGTGSRTLAYGTNFKFVAGTAPTLSTAAASVDRIDYVVASATKIHAVASLDVK